MTTTTAAKKKKGSGCGCMLLVLSVFVLLPMLAICGVALTVDTGGGGGGGGGGDSSPFGGLVDDPFLVGFCGASRERTRVQYERTLGGTASYLRGKVILVHLRIEAPGVEWTPAERGRMEVASVAVSKLYQREAARYGVKDLDLRSVSWPFQTNVIFPRLTPGARDILPIATSNALIAAVRKALRDAEKTTLDRVAAGYRQQGFDAVGFIAYVPTLSSARSFASPHATGANAELAFVFETKTLVGMASVAAHEGLHLFGADDLYRLTEDKGDAHDIMNACRGWRGNGVGEATAWSIGWRKDPPVRRYRF